MHTMSFVYLLLNCEEHAEEVLDEIKKIEHVREARETFGRYDAIVKVEPDSVKKVKQVLTEKIRNIGEIQSPVTLVAPQDEYNNNIKEPIPIWEEIRGLSWIFYEK